MTPASHFGKLPGRTATTPKLFVVEFWYESDQTTGKASER